MGDFKKGSNTRSSLLWEVQRLLKVASSEGTLPKYLIMENVKNIISKKFMSLFQVWLDFLEELGYKNYWKVMNARDYGVPQNRERCFMVSILNSDEPFIFPNKIELRTKLGDLLEDRVDEKYYLSNKLITCFASMKNRNGLVRGLRFRLCGKDDEYAWTITTCPGSRAMDTYIVEPLPAALRGRLDDEGNYKQQLEIKKDGCTNAITTVHKDNIIILPEATKKGYTIARVGDGCYTKLCQYKKGVVERNMIPTLKASCSDIGVVVEYPKELISLRRLTPRECWRLMG